jgi:ribosomal protein S27AE
MFIKHSTLKDSKATVLAVTRVDCPHCGAKKVAVLISDKKCPKCGQTINLSK